MPPSETMLQQLAEILRDDWPALLAIALVLVGWFATRWTVGRAYVARTGKRFSGQLVQLALDLLALLLIVLFLPLEGELKSGLVNLLGIVLSAAIALSSTTFLSNAMAGVMLRTVKSFRIGDLIESEGHVGRVTERGLLHVEIQTQASDLVTLPNQYLVTHPVQVTRATGTVISADVSLGYDVPRAKVEQVLLAAATEAGLGDPFVWILELGDFSVHYRAAGLLKPAKKVYSARSRLRGAMLDALHGAGIEIVSPTFMNTRRFLPTEEVIPPATASPRSSEAEAKPAEEVVFSKATRAEERERSQEELAQIKTEVRQLEKALGALADGPERKASEARLARLRRKSEQQAALLDRAARDQPE